MSGILNFSVRSNWQKPLQIGLLLILVLLCALDFSAQDFSVSGVVRSENETLPSATVIVVGNSNGTITDLDGRFRLQCQADDSLRVSFIGYKTRTVAIAGRTQIDILLKPAEELLEEVIVTALGISREEKSLGYSVGKMDVKSAATVRDPNVVNSMQGKVAGVNITKTSGGPGSSSRILIRGNSSITNGNQPLIVVDGLPIDNTTVGTGGTWGGIDYGSPISDINPDDIESLTVLKGPSAAALYGSRALNGVIVITTKSGAGNGKKWVVDINSTSSVESAYILKDFQNEYGAGSDGQFAYTEEGIPFFQTARPSTPTYASSWGPRFDDQRYIDWNGDTTTYSAQPDNYKKFFQSGTTFTNSVSASRGGKYPMRMSLTDLRNRGISPTSTFKRNNANFSIGGPLMKKLDFRVKITYADQKAYNRVNQSNGHNAARNIIMMPRNVSAESMMNFEDNEGNENVWFTDWGWIGNPFFTLERNINYDDRQRLISNLSLSHHTTDWLEVMGRIGFDRFDEERHNRIAQRSWTSPNGEFSEQDIDFFEVNADFLATAHHQWGENWKLNGSLGGNSMYQRRDFRNVSGRDLILFGDYSFDNAPSGARDDRTSLFERRMNSLYGSAQLSYKSVLFIETTGRNDWTSTLPTNNNSYYYPSLSVAWAFSEHIQSEKGRFEFGKLRASVAAVGNDADPYLLEVLYDSIPSINGVQLQQAQNPFPLVNLKPERKRSYELGLDLRFFQGRLSLDATYYNETTANQILTGGEVSATSGYTTYVANGGEVRNRGLEILLQSTFIDGKNLKWTNTVNFTKNRNLVIGESSDGPPQRLGNQWRINVEATPGLPYGAIFGYGIQRDAGGTPLLSAEGKYLRTEDPILLGNVQADWKMGIGNALEYKQWAMSFLVDIQKGGDLYSATNMYLHGYAGNVNATLEGRDGWYASEAARIEAGAAAPEQQGENYVIDWQPTGGYEVSGVYAEGTIINGEDVSGQSATRLVDPQDYWSQYAGWTNEIHEPFVYDAGYVKLREVAITYRFKKTAFGGKLRNASATLSGRNLWLIHSNVPNVDPEASYSNGNGQGLEYATYPITRSIGLNLKVGF